MLPISKHIFSVFPQSSQLFLSRVCQWMWKFKYSRALREWFTWLEWRIFFWKNKTKFSRLRATLCECEWSAIIKTKNNRVVKINFKVFKNRSLKNKNIYWNTRESVKNQLDKCWYRNNSTSEKKAKKRAMCKCGKVINFQSTSHAELAIAHCLSSKQHTSNAGLAYIAHHTPFKFQNNKKIFTLCFVCAP
jgi:hypothetical protein